MFVTLIVTLTAATVDGFPQLAVLHPQYQVQYLPEVPLSKKSLNDRGPNLHVLKVIVNELNSGGFQSNTCAALPGYRNGVKYIRLTAEPNSAFDKSEFFNQYGTSILNVEDGYTDQRSGLRARSGFKSVKTPTIYTPAKHQTKTNYQGNDISINVMIEQKPYFVSSKPEMELKKSFLSNENVQRDSSVRYRKINLNAIPNRILEIISRNLKSRHSNSLSDGGFISEHNTNTSISSYRNNNNEVNNPHKVNSDSAKDANVPFMTITQKELVQDLNAPNFQASNPRAVVESISSMQTPANSNAPENTEKNSFDSRDGLRSSGDTEEEDKWIRYGTETVETTTTDIENRVSFDGDKCATNMTKVEGQCKQKH